MKIIYGLIALLVVVAAALSIVPSTVSWDNYKPDITAQVEAAIGRKLWIDGDIDVIIFPSPRLRVSDVRLANMVGATSADMVRVKSLQVHLALGPLITGDIQVTSLTLVDPVIELERLVDGRANWQFDPVVTDAGTEDGEQNDGGSASNGDSGVRLDDVVLRNGTLIWRDHATGKTEYLQRINADITATSRNGPFRAKGSLVVRNVGAQFAVGAGEIRVGRPMQATALLDIGEGLLIGEFDGVVDDPRGTEPRLRGGLSASGENFMGLLASLSGAPVTDGQPDGYTTPALARPFTLEATTALTSRSLGLHDIRLRVGGVQADGQLDWLAGAGGGAGRIEADLDLRGLNLGKFSGAGPSLKAETKLATAVESDASLGAGKIGASKTAPAFARGPLSLEAELGALLRKIPADLSGGVIFTADAIRCRGGIIRQAKVVLALDESILTIEQAGALMPGGADAAVFGQIAPAPGGFAFDGRVELVADDLRAVMRWLDAESADIPADRLRRASVSTELTVSPTRIALRGADVRIDASRLAGDVAIDRVKRPRVLSRFSLDRLNWDAYQRQTSPANDSVVSENAAGNGQPTDNAESAFAGLSLQLLSGLPDVDIDLELIIGTLVRGGIAWEGVSLAGRLDGGDLTIREASVDRAAGTRIDVTGVITKATSTPIVDLTLTGDANSLAPLLGALGIKTNLNLLAIGEVGLAATVRGDEASLSVTIESSSSVGTVALFGTIERPLKEPAFVLAVRLRADDAGRFVEAMGLNVPQTVRRLGALAVDGGLDGDLGNLQINIGAEAADASLQFAGTVTGADTGAPAYDLNIDGAADDARVLLRALTGDDRYGVEAAAALRVRSQVQGDIRQARFTGFDAALGGNGLKGTGDVVLDGPLPVITAAFEAEELDLAVLVGGGVAANPAQDRSENGLAGRSARADGSQTVRGGEAAGRWSTEPISLAVFDEVIADIELRAEALVASGYRFEQAELDMAIADGMLEIYSLRGRIFDGLLEAEGRVSNGAPPGATLSFKLAGANMENLLIQTSGIDAVSGAITLDGRLATQGTNEAELVRGLGGEVHLAGGSGAIRGVDIGQISAQLSELDDAVGFAELARSGLSGGETPLHDVSGTVAITRGIAITNDTTLLVEAGEGGVQGLADLPAWQLDLTSLFYLTEQTNAPPVGVRLHGAIDQPQRKYLTDRMEVFLVEHFASRVVEQRAIPKLREGAKAEDGTFVDVLLRDTFGNPAAGESDPVSDEPAAPAHKPNELARQTEDRTDNREPNIREPSEPVMRAPLAAVLQATKGGQQGDTSVERPAERRSARDPILDPEDLIRGIFETLQN